MDGYREKLLGLDRERLVDALVKIAARPETAEDVIERLLNTPDEKRHRAKRAIADLKSGDQYYDWRASHAFALELEGVVETIVESAASPEEGIELLAEFFEADRDAIECADDSDGQIGAVYSMDATHAFIAFGQQCNDKAWLAERVIELLAGDDYGLREDLLESARDMFPEDSLRAMAERLWMMAEELPSGNHSADYRRRKCFVGVQTLARQLGDAPLYEKATRAAGPDFGGALPLDVARIYLETGDAGAALRLVKSADVGEAYRPEKDELLYTIHERQKNRAAWEEVAWRIFRRRRAADTFEQLLRAIGPRRRNTVLREERKAILEEPRLSCADAAFLIETGCLDDAAKYVLKHADQLIRAGHHDLAPMAEALENGGHPLAATLCYRALTDAVLARGASNDYHHGVRYLKRLDALAPAITGWGEFPGHREYVQRIVENHKRKRSFWGQYGGIPGV
ncbi:MAG: hypothetical protein KF886_01190 [Candidatus Hydrogenedentes bacterium]|nr:hypothetical protein [Candidatus Hydrogenedentota bacterium]